MYSLPFLAIAALAAAIQSSWAGPILARNTTTVAGGLILGQTNDTKWNVAWRDGVDSPCYAIAITPYELNPSNRHFNFPGSSDMYEFRNVGYGETQGFIALNGTLYAKCAPLPTAKAPTHYITITRNRNLMGMSNVIRTN
ncbi:hypothetical protein EXIGLDRAFT_725102 [Exidia glandulosa HHB12029]|uniref:Uncharacterized protein n=1 Tax=Exidia glandulosa HHB12029 TaxID=1314781 RepID=A0A165E6B5_EXIGL|nr:hypothetical protein EXIGLDRAFT_725102 [Exidia glandulosa HHB12029]